MAELRIVKKDDLTAIADKMREKLGNSNTVNFPDGFVDGVDGTYNRGINKLLIKNNFAEIDLSNNYIQPFQLWSNYAFAGATKLESIILDNNQNGYDSLPAYCFLNCPSLKNVKRKHYNYYGYKDWNFCISKDSIFENCVSLEELEFICGYGNGIGNRVFYGCISLKKVTPHTSTTYSDSLLTPYVGDYAFYNCTSFNELNWNITNWIGNYAFYNTAIPEINLSTKKALKIGAHAFDTCKQLTSITLNPYNTIGEYCFSNCNTLKTIKFENNSSDTRQYNGSIENHAFYKCSNLEEVYIGDGITTIGNYAFYGCSSLKKVSIPYTVTYIGSNAFDGCPIEEIEFRDLDKSQLKLIYEYAFRNTKFSSITIPNSCLTIYSYAFYGNTNLTSFNIADVKNSRLKTIDDYAFRGCSALENFTVPSNVAKIGNYVFAYTGISYINFLPTTPPTLGSGFLYRTNNLEYIYVPKDKNGGSYYVGLYSGVSGLSSSTYSKLITEWSETEDTNTETEETTTE